MWLRTKARGWSEARRILGRYPTLYFALGALRGSHFQDRKVSETTDIVIDGYPRSANSFAVGAFRQAQSDSMSVAHHLHVPAQIVRAVELDIPTILLIRHPVDSIVSYRALHKEGEIVEEEPRAPLQMGFRPFFRSWIDFYETTLPYAESVVIGRFKQVINDFGEVVRAVNSRFGENLIPFEHTEENVNRVNNARGYHAGPSDRRRRLKEKVQSNFSNFKRSSGEIVDRAIQLFEAYEQKAKKKKV